MTWVLAAVSITATVLTGRKVWWGWLVVAASCAAWGAYGLMTGQFGFVALQVFNVGLTSYNARRWWRERRPEQVDAPAEVQLGADGVAVVDVEDGGRDAPDHGGTLIPSPAARSRMIGQSFTSRTSSSPSLPAPQP